MKSTAAEEEVRFILTEYARYQQRLRERAPLLKEDFLCDLRHPDFRGHLPIGRKAYDRLIALARLAAKRGNITERADHSALIDALGSKLIQYFIIDQSELTRKSVARLLKESWESVASGMRGETYVLPCHISANIIDGIIDFGPVQFVSRAAAWRLIKYPLKRLISDSTYSRDRTLVRDALQYYAGYRWYALVDIQHASPRRAQQIAGRAAASALDCLQLFLGRSRSDRMSVGGHHGFYVKGSSISLLPSQDISLSSSIQWTGQGTLPDDWIDQLYEAFPESIERVKVLLELAVQPDLERPLSRRFLDAVQWFGEAVRESSPATRILKYVFAVERLVLTGEVATTELISTRVASLCTGIGQVKSFEQLRAEFRRVYDVRSKLVHGSISPHAAIVGRSVGQAAEFAQGALLTALYHWAADEFRMTRGINPHLKRWFGSVREVAAAFEPHAAEPTATLPLSDP